MNLSQLTELPEELIYLFPGLEFLLQEKVGGQLNRSEYSSEDMHWLCHQLTTKQIQ